MTLGLGLHGTAYAAEHEQNSRKLAHEHQQLTTQNERFKSEKSSILFDSCAFACAQAYFFSFAATGYRRTALILTPINFLASIVLNNTILPAAVTSFATVGVATKLIQKPYGYYFLTVGIGMQLAISCTRRETYHYKEKINERRMNDITESMM